MTATGSRRRFLGMKTLTITVPEPVARWLAQTAEPRKQTEAEVATETLVAAAVPPEPSLGDLLAEFKGIGQGKYTDLSTNERHLDDFGGRA